jgi:hypothetical protein
MHPDAVENQFDGMYPSYYSFVSDRLVCNRTRPTESYFGFTEESKIVYDKIIAPYLEPQGSASRKIFELESTNIYYLKNRLTGEYLKPVVVHIE